MPSVVDNESWRRERSLPMPVLSKPLRVFFVVCFAMAFVLGLSFRGAPAQVTDDSDDTAWVKKSIPGTGLTMRYPRSWVVKPTSNMDTADAGLQQLIEVGHPLVRNGDVVVKRWTGKSATWFRNYKEYQAFARKNLGDGTLLETGRMKVRGLPAYWYLQTYNGSETGDPNLFADLEIRTGKRSVVQFLMNVNGATPHARELLENIVRNVAAS